MWKPSRVIYQIFNPLVGFVVLSAGVLRRELFRRRLFLFPLVFLLIYSENGACVVVRALASHQCGPRSIPTPCVTCVLSLLGLYSGTCFSKGPKSFRARKAIRVFKVTKRKMTLKFDYLNPLRS